LYIDPILCCNCAIVVVFLLVEEGWLAYLPFVS
jgi:hypothetical protein